VFEHLRGVLEQRSPARAVVDVGGVGYDVAIPLSTFEKLPAAGSRVHLFVTLVVREDSQRLFGFATREERDFFTGLQGVSGIGPGVALAIVSSISWTAFRDAVVAGDAAQLRKVRGIGKRLSERLVVELRDKVGPAAAGAASEAPSGPMRDAQLALEQLGFARETAATALLDLRREQPSLDDAGELVRAALRRL
jgi:Holliday junction DNA helicase RuvA